MYHLRCNGLGLLRQPDMKKKLRIWNIVLLSRKQGARIKLISNVKETCSFDNKKKLDVLSVPKLVPPLKTLLQAGVSRW